MTVTLPIDVLGEIFIGFCASAFSLPDEELLDEGDAGARTLAKCMLVCKAWQQEISRSVYWRMLLQGLFPRAYGDLIDQAIDLDTQAEAEFKRLMRLRSETDLCIDAVTASGTLRIDAIKTLHRLQSARTKDEIMYACLQHKSVTVSEERRNRPVFRRMGQNWLSRRYWLDQIVCHLARQRVFDVWQKLSQGGGDLIESVAGLSCMLEPDCKYLMSTSLQSLNDLAAALITWPTFDRGSPVDAQIVAIHEVMVQHGYGPAAPEHYHDLTNHFLGHIADNKKTLPMTLVLIFVHLARSIGLSAFPVGYPGHMLAVVFDGSSRHYVDPFQGTRQLTIPSQTLIDRLRAMGASANDVNGLIAPSDPVDILMRICRNIRVSIRQAPEASRQPSAIYISWCIEAFLSTNGVAYLLSERSVGFLAERWPLDLYSLNRFALTAPPYRRAEAQAQTSRLEAALLETSTPLRRTAGSPAYTIGTVFRHKKYGYTGVIISWDLTCQAPDQWQAQMQIHRLPRGADQPFYQVLDDMGPLDQDGSANRHRYVAEENIEPLLVEDTAAVHRLLGTHRELGKIFDSIDLEHGVTRLVPAYDTLRDRPDDGSAFPGLIINDNALVTLNTRLRALHTKPA
ncbi:uncharacterized protein L969DRAFT_101844 [Mixia osmundae IAM 14324]|uniref:Hemimethylated DNA-binding domain-containing protein n=1 Tax=Mixia osmundae (strain CBS 9802 / IAM 14324 / JCM 22182 / KY 12970) TaxID=764103 RepID=G7DYU6_MIXOS|nr:uncharacterized protein L969DRAFT_101844 [Mixia osmundae IAM 14324]KEI41652.1 hypothetical protein L969DRAFT_101844 [Mixia osmundae IAM 14324]GAA95756.1 hypothetical protein E5Q_02413 [Mixia osmundae IAM 14324]